MLWLDDRYEQNTGCYGTSGSAVFEITNPSACYANSLIDAVRQLESLAYDFSGIESNAQVQAAQHTMCQAAANMVARSQDLHRRGVLVAAASLRPNNGGSVNVFSPTSYPHLRTLEELGFPLLHADESATFAAGQSFGVNDWFPACNDDPATCADLTPAYPVDFGSLIRGPMQRFRWISTVLRMRYLTPLWCEINSRIGCLTMVLCPTPILPASCNQWSATHPHRRHTYLHRRRQYVAHSYFGRLLVGW